MMSETNSKAGEGTADEAGRELAERHVVIVGGGSGIGRASAELAASLGATVTLASRDRAKLERAAGAIGSNAKIRPLDMTAADALGAWAEGLGAVDHLVVSASSVARGPLAEVSLDAMRGMFEAKLFGPWAVAQAVLPRMNEGGSMTFFSGVLSRRPSSGAAGLASVNAAVEGLSRALALELGPRLRVNAVSPGMVRSDAYAGMDEAAREAMYEAVGGALPLGRVGRTDDVAKAVVMAMTNDFLTGAVLDVDGGHMVA